MKRILRHSQSAFWVFMALAGFMNFYGTIRTEMSKHQPICPPIDREVQQ